MSKVKTYGKTTGKTLNLVECLVCHDSIVRKYFVTRHWPCHKNDSFKGRPCTSYVLKRGRYLALEEVTREIGPPGSEPPTTHVHPAVEKITTRFEMNRLKLNAIIQFIVGNRNGVINGLVSQPSTVLLLYGPPGTGKSTISGLIAEELGLESKTYDAMAIRDLGAGQKLNLDQWLQKDPESKMLLFEEIESGGMTTIQRLLKPILDQFQTLIVLTCNVNPASLMITPKFNDRIQYKVQIDLSDADLQKLVNSRIKKVCDHYQIEPNASTEKQLIKIAKRSFRQFETTLNLSAFRSKNDKFQTIILYEL